MQSGPVFLDHPVYYVQKRSQNPLQIDRGTCCVYFDQIGSQSSLQESTDVKILAYLHKKARSVQVSDEWSVFEFFLRLSYPFGNMVTKQLYNILNVAWPTTIFSTFDVNYLVNFVD